MSITGGDSAVFVFGEEERTGRAVRVHEPNTNNQLYGRAEGEIDGDLLP